MSEWVTINGHRPDCAYICSLARSWEPEAPCDCDYDDLDDVIDDEMYADGDYEW